jgi:hypothetical protein
MSSRKNSSSKRNQQNSPGVGQGALFKRALTWIVTKDTFADMRLHGNVSWMPQNLVS